jgi:cobalamin biosynthesis Mg chelatase CobN
LSTIVTLDLNNFDTDDLIAELEDRDYTVLVAGQNDADKEALENMHDEIHNLYQAFLCWKDFSMKDSTFENDLKKFFENTIDMKVL